MKPKIKVPAHSGRHSLNVKKRRANYRMLQRKLSLSDVPDRSALETEAKEFINYIKDKRS